MELDDNETAVHSDPVNAQPHTNKVSELELYDELTAFVELSPEEQALSIERQERAFAQASMTSAAHSEQTTGQQPDQTHASSGLVDPEATATDSETSRASEVEHDASPEEIATDLTFEPVQTEEAAAEADTTSAQEPEEYPSLEPPSRYLAIEGPQSEAHSVEEATEDASIYPAVEPALLETGSEEEATEEDPPTYLAVEPAQSATGSEEESQSSETGPIDAPDIPVVSATAAGPESGLDSEGSDASGELQPVRPPEVEGPRPSGPLSGFNLPANIVYTGSLSRGVCLACGAAESGADDLFCPACGVFIDELGLTAAVDSTCAECKQVIAADEIFCPWCGSSLPA